MILKLIQLFLAYFLPWLVGYLILRLLDYRRQFADGFVVFAALPVGVGIFSLEIFVLGILGLTLFLKLSLGLLAVNLAGLSFAAWLAGRLTWRFDFSGFRGLSAGKMFLLIAFVLILLFRVGAAGWQIVHMPIYEFDAWNTWDLRGKVIYTEGAIPLDKTQQFYLGGGLNSYPMGDTLWKVWVATMFGSWQESAVNLYSVVFYLFLTGLFYFSLPPAWSFGFRLLSAYALSSLPFLYLHSWVAYADLEFAAYCFLAVAALFWFLRSNYPSYLWLSGLAVGLAIWIKNEGFVVLAPVIFVSTLLMVFEKKLPLKRFGVYWAVIILSVLPWLGFRFFNHLAFLNGNSSTFKMIFNSAFFGEWFSTIFLRSHFNFLWLLLFILCAWKWKELWRDPAQKYLAITLGLLFLVYNGVVLFTDRAYDLSVLARADLQIVPLAVFMAAAILEPLLFVARR